MKKYNIDPLTGQLVEDKEGHLCLVAESEAENLESYDEMKNHKNEVIRKAIVIKKLKEENKHLQDIFDLQYTRTLEAGKIWREETGNPGVHPDLGVLIGWLLERKNVAVKNWKGKLFACLEGLEIENIPQFLEKAQKINYFMLSVMIKDRIKVAVEAENEACAKTCENRLYQNWEECAKAIRLRSK